MIDRTSAAAAAAGVAVVSFKWSAGSLSLTRRLARRATGRRVVSANVSFTSKASTAKVSPSSFCPSSTPPSFRSLASRVISQQTTARTSCSKIYVIARLVGNKVHVVHVSRYIKYIYTRLFYCSMLSKYDGLADDCVGVRRLCL